MPSFLDLSIPSCNRSPTPKPQPQAFRALPEVGTVGDVHLHEPRGAVLAGGPQQLVVLGDRRQREALPNELPRVALCVLDLMMTTTTMTMGATRGKGGERMGRETGPEARNSVGGVRSASVDLMCCTLHSTLSDLMRVVNIYTRQRSSNMITPDLQVWAGVGIDGTGPHTRRNRISRPAVQRSTQQLYIPSFGFRRCERGGPTKQKSKPEFGLENNETGRI